MKCHATGKVGQGGVDGGNQIVRQRKVPVGDSGRAAAGTVAGLLPVGTPASVRQRVREAADEFMMKVLSAMTTMRAIGEVAVSNVNRVVQNGDEYLLFTQNGKIVPLRDTKMVRVFLMYVCNHGRLLTIGQIQDAEQLGHWKLAPECGDTPPRQGVSDEEQEDVVEREWEEAEPCRRMTRSARREQSREANDAYIKGLKMAIAQNGRELKKAKSQRDEVQAENIVKGRQALRATLNDLYRERYGHHGPELSESERNERRRIQMTISHIVEMVERKDPELAYQLDVSMSRDGRFGYLASPTIQWDVCENLLASSRKARVPASASMARESAIVEN